jgi:putative cell wall-binding protein
VLLVSKDEVPTVAGDALTRLNPDRVVIAGGPAAVSEEVARQLRSD